MLGASVSARRRAEREARHSGSGGHLVAWLAGAVLPERPSPWSYTLMEPDNPFAVLSLIVAPAILTNATSVLTMSTSNRLARAVDRAREISTQLEAAADLTSREATRRLHELSSAENRALLLVRALSSFYTALGGFASATLLSLLGAVLVSLGTGTVVRALEVVAVVTGLIAVGALVHGSTLLVRETRIAVAIIRERAAAVRLRAAARTAP